MSEHTKEPWDWYETSDKEHVVIRSATEQWLVDIGGDWPEPARSNARRIVACVNACAGLSTEALESGTLGELIKSATKLARYCAEESPGMLTSAEYRMLKALRVPLAKLEGK